MLAKADNVHSIRLITCNHLDADTKVEGPPDGFSTVMARGVEKR